AAHRARSPQRRRVPRRAGGVLRPHRRVALRRALRRARVPVTSPAPRSGGRVAAIALACALLVGCSGSAPSSATRTDVTDPAATDAPSSDAPSSEAPGFDGPAAGAVAADPSDGCGTE